MDRPTEPELPDVGEEPDDSEENSRIAGEISDLVTAMIKELRARQTYVSGNPLIERFHRDVRERFARLWEDLPHLALAVDESRLKWRDLEVYSHPVGHDNFAFQFFRDGIRQLAFLPGGGDEIEEFLQILAEIRPGKTADLLATLWHRDFDFIRMEYVDVSEEEALELPRGAEGVGGDETISDLSEIEDVLSAGPIPPDEEAEFASLLLGEADEAYLRREMDAEFNRPLMRDVTLALLDQFEMRDQERRRQVVDIVRELLPRLLDRRDFSTVALIVTELQLLANKTGEADTQALVTSLLRDMSEAMAELISLASESTGPAPADDELTALLGALQAEAIPILVRAVPSLEGTDLREPLSDALDRLVSTHPDSIRALLRAEDPMLVAEAARIVARLRIGDAEGLLSELLSRPETVVRLGALEALASLESQAGIRALFEALDDTDREIRVSAIDAIERIRPPGAEAELRRRVDAGSLARLDDTERMHFLKGCVAVCGDSIVSQLSKVLNGRRWWGGRHPVALRAGAARALGLAGSSEARRALERSSQDRAPAVASAVRAAVRHIDGAEGDPS
ncbi:MAG: HEAT repeat domain-containing protein [marine benthic group bacterium]|nr:HEAT repeat domain-containing protein [Gemmatimonadota bacterium]MCL7984562.1 HEAT repeat domain-containing protein [Gemmatimonadota bacterium]